MRQQLLFELLTSQSYFIVNGYIMNCSFVLDEARQRSIQYKLIVKYCVLYEIYWSMILFYKI
jgi:hypothetical protein